MTAHFPPNASPSGYATASEAPSRSPRTSAPPAQMSAAPAHAASAPAIALHGLTRSYAVPGRSDAVVHALAGVDLELAEGSFTAVVGASGSGKSTLLQCVAGLDQPSSGTVHLLGTQTTSLRPSALATFRAKHMGVIFQEDNLVTCLNARDNVALPGRLRQRALPHQEVDNALARVVWPTTRTTFPPSSAVESVSGSPSPGSWPRARRSSSPTSPPPPWTWPPPTPC